MHADPTVVDGPIGQEIVRTCEQSQDAGGNDRQLDLAWAAGFFDGEGYIGLHQARKERTFDLQLSLAQVDRRLVERFQRIMGGQVRRYRTTQSGNRAPWKSVWYAWGNEAADCLRAMAPYLVGKLEQALVAIDFQAGKRAREWGIGPNGRNAWRPAPDEEIVRGQLAWDRLRALRAEIKANS